MKWIKSLLTVPIVFMLFLLFVSQMVVSPVWAKKPPKPPVRTYTRYLCYARLVEEPGSVIASDGGDYMDLGLGGNDKVQVEIYDDNYELKFVRVFIGKMELPYRSPRRANFMFDLYEDATDKLMGGKAVYDSLVKLSANGSRRGIEQPDGKYYLTDGTVHFLVRLDTSGFNECGFIVDPGCLAAPASDPPPISQTTVDAFYDDDDNIQYWTPIQASLEKDDPNIPRSWNRHKKADPHDQIAYFFYVNQLQFNATKFDNGKPYEWEIIPSPDATGELYVRHSDNYWSTVHLATYGGYPFKLLISLYPFTGTLAPPKYDTLTSTWGKIKEE